MKTWNYFVTVALIGAALTLSACGGSKGGGSVATAPADCSQYYWNGTAYINPVNGQVVQCNQAPYGTHGYPGYGGGYYGSQYGGYMPYYTNGCEGWSQMYPGNVYQPMNLGYGMVCVRVDYMMAMPGFNTYYNMYGGYPTYTCQWGVNCNSRCYGGATGGGTAQLNFGGFYLGGTLGMCW